MKEDKRTMSEFPYSIEQTRECILATEASLRLLVSRLMSRTYGSEWDMFVSEQPSPLMDESTYLSLVDRREAAQEMQPDDNKASAHLLDYSEITHLRNLIKEHWSLFSPIFLSEGIIVLLDQLKYLRSPLMSGGGRMALHRHYLCLGICGEVLSIIQHWQESPYAIKG